jgi:hypothetical protein
MAENGNGLGIKPTLEVELRVPQIPGVDPRVLVAMAQQIMGELQFWAPLTPPQALADAAGAVLGDVPRMEQIRGAMAKAPEGSRMRLYVLRRSLISMQDESEAELMLESPTRASETFGDTGALASFMTIVGLLTSPTARALLVMSNRRMVIEGPFVSATAEDKISTS